ncbi:Fic family protein [Citricoccus sp. I39-566]|uniref:Fic family protein n=1 Tax=Citricoccus sp. I39-566 TaxID=3073268 RepID=UPI00286BF679|nr:Fic family protein [Citricoccus sp. I39-566]WMY78482.1 Fic family protein [Citricoccus sp. I39-566]
MPIDVDPVTAAEAADAAMELVRFDAEVSPRPGGSGVDVWTQPTVLLHAEATASSRIEQVTAGARALALATIGKSGDSNAGLVAANVHATERAIALPDGVTADGIVQVQDALLTDSAPGHAGGFRNVPVWIGSFGCTPHTASFVAPRPERVPELMGDLVAFIRRTDVDPFVQAAVAHAQFETIHPFTDGNGRTGRALVQAMLRRNGITRRLTVPLSAGLLASTDSYYAAFGSYRDGDLNDLVTSFAAAAHWASAHGRDMVRDLESLMESWTDRLKARSHAAVWKALPLLIQQPAVTVQFLAESLGASEPAAQHAVDQMVEAGILAPVDARRRSRMWTADEVIQVADGFASRADRRSGS